MKKSRLIWLLSILSALSYFFILFSPPLSSQEISPNLMEAANKAVEEGKFEEAIKIYSSILEKDPDNFAAQVRLARTYYFAANNNPEYFYKAVKEYHVIIQKWPDFSLPYLHLGQIAYILGLTAEVEGKEKHAEGLYESALHWFEEYIKKVKKENKTIEGKREIVRTKILEAVVYSRKDEQDAAAKIVIQAKKDYKELSPKEWGESPLYDFFLRSAIDYIASKLYNQALIYLEGAWIIKPNAQVKNLFQSVVKAKDTQISLTEPLQLPEEKEKAPSSQEKVDEEKIKELTDELKEINTKIETLPSLKKEIETLKEETSSIKEEIQSLKNQLSSISEFKKELDEKIRRLENLQRDIKKENKKTEEQKIQGTPEIEQHLSMLDERVRKLNEKVENIKSIADSLKLFKIQLQELIQTVENMKEKIVQFEQNKQNQTKENQGE